MVRIAVFPIIAVAVLAILAIIALVIVLSVKSRNGKLLALLPIGAVVCLLLLVGGLTIVRTSIVHQEVAAAEQLHRDQSEAAMHAARAAYQSQVLDYRGDSTEPVAVENAAQRIAPSIEFVRYSPIGTQSEQSLSQLPGWVADHNDFDPQAGSQSFVLSSEPWSSVEEAEEELYGLLAVHAGNYLSATYPESEGWYPTRDMLRELPLIQDAVRERVPLEIGEHTVHVQHAHWQVELTPDIRERLFELWRPTVVQERLVHLGAGLGALTLLFAMVAGILRFRQRPRTPAREATAAVAAIAILLAGISALVSA